MKLLPDKVYTILKWVLGVCIAPTITLLLRLGKIYNFDPIVVVETIAAVASFLSAIFGISIATYKGEE